MGQMSANQEYHLYNDMKLRTGGEIYIGVVGPVRTGKSTFIKRFMEVMVLPQIANEHERIRTRDELPQSSGGKTITTTEPKFIPKEACQIEICDGVQVKLRMIDCVGYMVEGATGHIEENRERLVRTPWFEEPILFTQAAEIGTRKVIQDHSTIGIVITTDGTLGGIAESAYAPAEERTIRELQNIGKPFIVLVNSLKPYSEEAQRKVELLEQKYQVKALAMNVEQLRREHFAEILEQIMYEFPITVVDFLTPKWMDMLAISHPMKQEMIGKMKEVMGKLRTIRDILEKDMEFTSEYIKRCKFDHIDIAEGMAAYQLETDSRYYYDMLSQLTGEKITGEYQLVQLLATMTEMKREYSKVKQALDSVRQRGYGVVTPEKNEITLETPTVIRHGNKYGVKIKAQSPSIHLIKANIETEIAPIVGTQQQALDLINYISDAESNSDGIWETNIFGKTIEQLVQDGINGKIAMIGDASQVKLQDTMQKIVNDSNGGMVCIII